MVLVGRYLPVNCFPIAPLASNTLGLSLPRLELAGVWIAEAIPVDVLEPVLELPWADMCAVEM